jgi:hypothetical protein
MEPGRLMADPINADCRTDYHAAHSSGTRPLDKITLIVLHSTEGGTAKTIAQYFSSRAAGGSAHLVVDDSSCYRCLTNEQIPWAAPGANTQGFHIEQCGYASWTASEWNRHLKTLQRAAFKTAYHCHLFNIPVRFVNAAGLRAAKKGITTHAEVSKAWPNRQGNHHDPGTGWPRAEFIALAQKYYDELANPDV